MYKNVLRRFIAYIILLIITASGSLAQADNSFSKQDYINKYSQIAVSEMERTGIPASITLAQGILESRYGNSQLATDANNHFGIKCHSSWRGKKIYYDDDQRNECFRKYLSADESFIDHSDFISNGGRYAFLFDYHKNDYKSWAQGLKTAGYATNPKYPKLLIKIIEEEGLSKYDKMSKWEMRAKEDPDLFTKEYGIFQFNRIKTVLVRHGDSPLSLAMTFEISLARLMKYNDLPEGKSLVPGEMIFLQPKRSKGDEKYHTVLENETLHSIAQKHGIKLAALMKRNLLVKGDQVQAGEILYLKGRRSSIPAVNKSASARSARYHVVKKGETLYGVARKYQVTVDDIQEWNSMRGSGIFVGQKLRVR